MSTTADVPGGSVLSVVTRTVDTLSFAVTTPDDGGAAVIEYVIELDQGTDTLLYETKEGSKVSTCVCSYICKVALSFSRLVIECNLVNK